MPAMIEELKKGAWTPEVWQEARNSAHCEPVALAISDVEWHTTVCRRMCC